MPALEIGYCSLKDYEAEKTSRLMPEDLAMGELYVLMVALSKTEKRKREHGRRTRRHVASIACRELCEVYDVEKTDSGLYRVEFNIVDEDGDVVWEESGGEFTDGFWTGIEPGDNLGYDDEPVISGYLQGYNDPLDAEIRDFFDRQDLPLLVSAT